MILKLPSARLGSLLGLLLSTSGRSEILADVEATPFFLYRNTAIFPKASSVSVRQSEFLMASEPLL
jgi:hypothetical protein